MKIKAAAIILEGVIFTLPPPHRHIDIWEYMVSKHGVNPAQGTQGFITDSGEFVDRSEAYKIAKESHQILPSEQYSGRPNQLYSEDLW